MDIPVRTLYRKIGRCVKELFGYVPGEKEEEKGPKLEEVEIFEYRLMKKQLAYLARTYPTNKDIKGLEVPVVTGEEGILPRESKTANRTLDCVGIDLDPA